MVIYGCMWVSMGAMGYEDTNAQENKTIKNINRLTVYDSRPRMAGKFPPKRHICAHKYKGDRRDPGGWVWVCMGLGGCICTQQTQNKTNRDIYVLTGHNFGEGVGGEIG